METQPTGRGADAVYALPCDAIAAVIAAITKAQQALPPVLHNLCIHASSGSNGVA